MTVLLLERLDDAFALSTEEQDLLAVVRRLAAERICPRAESHDLEASFPWDNLEDLNALGLNQMFVPVRFGGAPVSYRCYLQVVRAISKCCAATGVTWATTFHAIAPVIEFGDEDLKARVLPQIAGGGLGALAITEASGGSDVALMSTQLAPEADEIVIRGSKLFITNGDFADVILLLGKWAPLGTGREAISAVLVERTAPGLSVTRRESKLGHRASSTVELAFDGVRVPAGNLVGAPGDGLRILRRALDQSRPSVAAQALGIAEAALEDALEYVRERRQFGRAVGEFQGVRFALSDMVARLAMTTTWLANVGRLVDAGAEDIATEASIVKVASSDLAMDAALLAMQLFGGAGYCGAGRVERLFRDAKLTQIWEGANELHRSNIGRAVVRASRRQGPLAASRPAVDHTPAPVQLGVSS